MVATTAADERAVALPEDVLFEIFSRVPSVRDVLRCALTCKPWLRLLTDRTFLCRLWPDLAHGHLSRLLGFFFQNERLGDGKRAIRRHTRQRYSVSAPTFLPTPGSWLGPGGDCALTSFVADDGGSFNYAELLASRNGIVLMRLIPRSYKRMKDALIVCLCNPITGERHIAPPLECACLGRYMNGYAILESPGRSMLSQSQVLVTGYNSHGDCHLHLHSYSAARRSWSTPTRCHDGNSFFLEGAEAAQVHRGLAHWLYSAHDRTDRLYILSSEGTAVHTSFAKLPISIISSPTFLYVSRDDRLSIARVYLTQMDVWTQQERDGDGHVTWLCTHVIQMSFSKYSLGGKWFAFNKGSLLALYNSDGGGIFVFDIERKVMDKVMGCPPCLLTNGYGTCVPFEVDLSEFFLLQLGGLSRG
ncbi:hypothetical protein EJB05_40402, partial [Eragrostis curvula]